MGIKKFIFDNWDKLSVKVSREEYLKVTQNLLKSKPNYINPIPPVLCISTNLNYLNENLKTYLYMFCRFTLSGRVVWYYFTRIICFFFLQTSAWGCLALTQATVLLHMGSIEKENKFRAWLTSLAAQYWKYAFKAYLPRVYQYHKPPLFSRFTRNGFEMTFVLAFLIATAVVPNNQWNSYYVFWCICFEQTISWIIEQQIFKKWSIGFEVLKILRAFQC